MSPPSSPRKPTRRSPRKPAVKKGARASQPRTAKRASKGDKHTARDLVDKTAGSPRPSRAASLRAKPPPVVPMPFVQRWSQGLAVMWRIPAFVYLLVGALLLVILVPSVNWVYQVARKPSELFFPVSDDLYKTPSATWQSYGELFVAHSTPIMTPELLAALAQKEASGNPVARTYWRWARTLDLFEIYRPASSAVGMYQFTDGTFDDAKHYCIHDHRVVADGPWHDLQSCWFNGLYARVIPSHAVELASSNLDRQVRAILARKRVRQATLRQQQELAIIVHLCGAGAGAAYAARGLHLAPGQRCGDHDPRQYVERVLGLMRTFAALRH